jgi:hypothetical protein
MGIEAITGSYRDGIAFALSSSKAILIKGFDNHYSQKEEL